MRTDLSSLIKLGQVSRQHFHPSAEMELASLTRCEKIPTTINCSPEEGAAAAARFVAKTIDQCVQERGRCVIGLGAGRCALDVYDELVKMYFADKVSFANVEIFNISELWIGNSIALDSEQSTMRRINERLINKIDILPEHVHTFSLKANDENVFRMCKDYEAEIDEFGGLDIVVCELTKSGSVAFNDPGSAMSTGCRLTSLSNDARRRVADSYQCNVAPHTAVTLGMSNFLGCRNMVCVAWGIDSSEAVRNAVEGLCTDQVPASFLQMHASAHIYVDIDAASSLTRLNFPWRVASCNWDDQLVRRAVVWLCGQTGKPILKLTNKDYHDNGLSELVVLYGSAYNVNLKVFNNLQNTITGWPGGKPNADDTHRPERSAPFPKRVVIFSPHPDDAVVSMGGTLRKLTQQGHEVYVVFQTSGDVAVSNNDLTRTVMLIKRISKHYGLDNKIQQQLDSSISSYISNMAPGDVDDSDMRYIKGEIFVCEGLMACNYMGVKSENVIELKKPFYTEAPFGKGRVNESDIAAVKRVIEQIQPHQIYFAGDMNDPYGTHSRAIDSVLGALDQLKDSALMQQCRVWMYRGQWASWNIDDVDMSVPMSPEEFRFKRDAILNHQSQIHDAPFRDTDDDKLSWQRSIDRNKSIADLYAKLGLAAYEAIEAFVQYDPAKSSDEK